MGRLRRPIFFVDLIGLYSNQSHPCKSIEELRHLTKNVAKALSEAPAPPIAPTQQIWEVGRRLGKNTVAQLVSDYADGAPTTELAFNYGIAKSTVLRILKDNSVSMRRQPMTSDQVAQAIRHYESGKSLAQTAAELEMPKQSVRLALLASSVTMRPGGGQSRSSSQRVSHTIENHYEASVLAGQPADRSIARDSA